MRREYKADLDGLSPDDTSLRQKLVQFTTSTDTVLLLCLIVDHIPLSAILLIVQLQAADCNDSLPVSVRNARICLAAWALVVDSTWRLMLVSRRLLTRLWDWKHAIRWYTALLQTGCILGSITTTSLSCLCLVMQLMTSNFNVTPPGLVLRTVSNRIQFENWIASTCIIGHITESNNQTDCEELGQVICVKEFIDKMAETDKNSFSRYVIFPNCTSVDDLMPCLLILNFRFAQFPIIYYSYTVSFHDIYTTASQPVTSTVAIETTNNTTTETFYKLLVLNLTQQWTGCLMTFQHEPFYDINSP